MTLQELELFVKSAREKEHRMFRFYAAFKGVDLDKETNHQETPDDAFERAQRRANARLDGETDESVIQKRVDLMEFDELGIEYEE